MNDVWELTTLAGNGDLIVEIYNRWGEIVFYSKGYSEPWNGTYKGSPVPEGTYAYVIRVDTEKIFRGAVLVAR
jgi:gliding motility-associated-like protein